jgi:hypothetical protein
MVSSRALYEYSLVTQTRGIVGISADENYVSLLLTERGVVYEFRLAAQNEEDFGEEAAAEIRTPDGSKYLKRQ